MTKAEYANAIMESYDSVLIPPVGCVVHMHFIHAPSDTPVENSEAEVEITNIDISPNLLVTLTARYTKDTTKSIFLIPDEIIRVVLVPDGVPNPYHWWHRPKNRKSE